MAFSCGTSVRRRLPNPGLFLLLTIPLICAFIFSGLPQFWGSSEAREAHVAAEILRTGNWILPTRDGLVPSKPLLFHWIVAGVGLLTGGVNEWSARIVSVIAGFCVVLITARLAAAYQMRGHDGLNSATADGVLAGAVLLTSYGFVRMLCDARVDMLFALCTTAAIARVMYEITPARLRLDRSVRVVRPGAMRDFFILCALACLAKGPLGLVLPCVVVTAELWCAFGSFRSAVRTMFAPRFAWLIFLMLALPWYLLAAFDGGGEFIGRQIIFENVRRLLGGERISSKPWWHYLPTILCDVAPWSVIFVALLVRMRQRVVDCRVSHYFGGPGAAWFISGFVLFTIASGKRDSYLLPLFPGLALYLDHRIREWLSGCANEARARIFASAHLLLAIICAAALISLTLLELAHRQISTGDELSDYVIFLARQARPLVSPALALLASCSFAGIFLRRPAWRWSLASGVLTGVAIVLSALGLFIKGELKQHRQLASLIDEAGQGEVVIVRDRYDEFFDPLMFYLRRPARLELDLAPSLESGTIYLARAQFVREKIGKTSTNYQVLATFANVHDRIEGSRAHEIALFRVNN